MSTRASCFLPLRHLGEAGCVPWRPAQPTWASHTLGPSPEEGGTDVPISALARAPCALPSSPVGDSCADRPTVSIGRGLATAWWRSGLQSPASLGSLPRAPLPSTVQASFCFWNHLQTVQGARWCPQIPQHRWLSQCSEPTETLGSDGPPVGATLVLALLPLGKLTCLSSREEPMWNRASEIQSI